MRIKIAFIIVALSVANAFCDTAGSADEIFYYGQGARAMGMGRAFMAVSDDVNSTYWNIAGMGMLPQQQVTASQSTLLEGVSYNFLGYVYPFVNRNALGVSINMLSTPSVEKRDINNVITGSFNYQETGLDISYSQPLTQSMLMGVGLRYLSRSLDTAQSALIGVNMAAMYDIAKRTRAGIKLDNVLSFAQGDTDDTLPMAIKMGVSQKFFDDRLLLDLDLDPMASQIFLGGEMRFHQIAVRMGLNSSETSAGFGYTWKNYSFDYAIVYSPLLLSNRISVNCSFGTNLQKERERLAMAFYRKAEDSYGVGKYRKAMDYFGQGAVLFETAEYRKKADTLRRFMEQYGLADTALAKKGETQFAGELLELTKNMVKAYLDGNMPEAARNARIILSTNSGNELAKEISKAVGGEDSLEMQGLTKSSIIEVKLQRAVKYFNEKNYEKAIKECREVIELDPNNEMAYVRLGSAYLMFGAQDEAKKIWEKALQINPKNKDLQDFLKRLK